MDTHTHTLKSQWKTEEKYRCKEQGIWRIKHESDGNQTEIGRSKVTKID